MRQPATPKQQVIRLVRLMAIMIAIATLIKLTWMIWS